MAKLQFTKNGDKWIAEAKVTHDYHLHLERKGSGGFTIYQRGTSSGQYMDCRPNPYYGNWGQVIDWGFSHGIYPSGGLSVRFESATEVTMAEINEGA